MHEIKFRGKDKDNNWVYGDLIHGVGAYKNGVFILPMTINLAYVPNCDPINGVRVDENTVCQFTGLKDKNGKDIYEGDLLKANDGVIYEVWYSEIIGCFVIKMVNHKNDWADILGNYYTEECFEAIGNIYDNKELLKGE